MPQQPHDAEDGHRERASRAGAGGAGGGGRPVGAAASATRPGGGAEDVALVTGASSGIGRALALRLAREGWAVGAVARRGDRLRSLAEEIERLGGRVAVEVADVADREGLRAAVGRIEDALGPIALLVANAGISRSTDALAPQAAAFEQEVRVNLLGTFYALEAVVPSMRDRGRGHVVCISSLAGWRGLPSAAGYCATKAGLSAMMESLRLDWRDAGIRATTVHPGFVVSEITTGRTHPMPFLMDTDRAARRIARAIRRGKRVYNFPWPTVWLARLGRLVPDAVLRRLDWRRKHRRPSPAPGADAGDGPG